MTWSSAHNQERQRERSNPSAQRERQRAAADLCEVDFHARHEQRRCHADEEHHRQESAERGAQNATGAVLDQAQHVGPDENSEHDLQHNDRNPQADRYLGQERRNDRHSEDDQYRVIGKHHLASAGTRPRARPQGSSCRCPRYTVAIMSRTRARRSTNQNAASVPIA